MKRPITAPSVMEMKSGVATRLRGEERDAKEQAEFHPLPEQDTSPEGWQVRPLTLVLTMLALALIVLIPSLLLMQRLQP